MEPSALDLVSLLVQSRLFDEAGAQGALEDWRTAAGAQATDADAWLRWLVETKRITEYQSSLLSRGHAEGYFLRDFKILDRVGRGRMAGVYRAVDASGETVAIKVLPPSKAKDPILLARFQREARLLKRLNHSNVVRAREVGEADGCNFLIMEYLQGETLDAVLNRKGSLGVQESIDLLEQALCGLEHIHEKGMIHRDLKPANMLIAAEADAGPVLKILDFGLSRATDEEFVPDPVGDMQLTAAGTMLGTPDYVAPEQARDARSVDIRADIYSLGCVAYHMLAGRPPFPDKNALRQMVRHATEIPPPLQQVCPETPAFLQDLVERMLAKNPAERFESPAKALEALRAPTRETQSFTAAPSVPGSADPTRALAIVTDPPQAFDLAAEAPTMRQAVFVPLPAGAATKTLTTSNTPVDLLHPRAKHETVTDQPAEGTLPGTPRHKRKTPRPSRHGSDPSLVRAQAQIAPVTQDNRAAPRFHWTQRDTLVFAAGAATALLAIGLGALLSWMLHGN